MSHSDHAEARPAVPPIDGGLIEVAVPVFNEEAVLEANVTRLCRYLEQHFPFRWRVVIVDNASTDGTAALAAELAGRLDGVRALHVGRKGRGRALRCAWETSEADVVAYMDVDLSTNLESFLPLVSPLLSGHSEVAIGSRLAPRARVLRRPVREVLSRGYNRLVRLLFATRFSDAQCGFKALRADAARRLLPRVENDNWFFDTELLLLAEQDGMRIYEVPVDWTEDLDSRVAIPATIREDLAGLWRMRSARRERPGWRAGAPVAAVTALALLLRLWALDGNGLGNSYYAAAVRSMAQSWHNFFFASFDPGGFISIDKPPLAAWMQTGFVKIFGFSSWSLLVPSALAGAGAVLVLYLAVARAFGRSAGLLAALVLALTPVSVAVDRSNNPDALLVLLVVLAAWAVQRAVGSGRLRSLLWASVALVLAFNTKTLEAYIVVPALWLAYLVAAPRRLRVRIGHLALASVLLFGLSGAWVMAVDATPAQARPYVGGSTDNSAVNLAFGYNGLRRLNGQGEHHFGGFAGEARRPAGPVRPAGAATEPPGLARATGGDATLRAMGRRFFGDRPGPLRLLGAGLADQAGWLLPLAAVGGVAALVLHRRRDAQLGSLLVWTGWLATTAVVFSFAQGIFHPYYLSLLAPAAAALVGIGVVALGRGGSAAWSRLAVAAALGATAVLQWTILRRFPGYAPWLAPLVVAATVAATALVLAARRRPAVARCGLALGAAALLAGPVVWSVTTVGHPAVGNMNIAGPAQAPRAFTRLTNGGLADEARLVGYLEANRGGARYLAATTNALAGAPLILDTGQPVMAMGGFIGMDPALTPKSLAALIDRGEVRYFLVGSGFGGRGGGPAPLSGAVASACRPVDDQAWGGSAPFPFPPAKTAAPGEDPRRERFALHLYDCQGAGSAVAAAAARPPVETQASGLPGPSRPPQ